MKIKIAETTLNYKIHGTGKPIYFFHGMSLDSTSMEEIYEPLMSDSNYQRIYLDLPGLGDSQDIKNIHNSDDVLQIVIEFIQQLSGNDPIMICGHSFGGYICLGLLVKLKDQITDVFLTSPVINADRDERDVSEHHNIFNGEVKLDKNKDYYQDFLASCVIINQTAWELYQRMAIPGLKKNNRSFWSEIKTAHHYSFEFEKDIPLILENSKANMTILLGKNDQVVGYRDQLKLLSSNNNVQIAVLNNAGHNPFTDKFMDLKFYFDNFTKKY
ncbi:alpha/beta fold hydrolase [Companilactobacillus sp. HBUAS59699]|uniref:alpha/beta fold hydrolase n=1 Tax=Companilactobacillus sp. HBUAS59699 TaxID=3109358 RepID=UPI002FF1EBFB